LRKSLRLDMRGAGDRETTGRGAAGDDPVILRIARGERWRGARYARRAEVRKCGSAEVRKCGTYRFSTGTGARSAPALPHKRAKRAHTSARSAPAPLHSYRSATVGSRVAARRAGQTPKTTPTSAEKTKASRIESVETSVEK